VHDHRSRRFGLRSNAGHLGAALVVCLSAGQLAASAPVPPAAATTTATTTTATTTTATGAERASAARTLAAPAPHDRQRKTSVAAAARARAAVAGTAQAANRAERNRAASTPGRTITSRTARVAQQRAVHTVRPVTIRSAAASRILAEARRHIGKPYRWGAAGPRAFDCSGYTRYVFARAVGVRLPHRANSQQYYGRAVARSAARPGDLIFFRSGTRAYHVGIYAGGGYMYDAPRAGKPVGKHRIWSSRYVVRRLVG
jgi:peptidoglycan DL-endopeptidase CwlO